MKAIIQTAGKQYLVKEGDTISIDKSFSPQAGETIEFKEILAIGEEGELQFGNPLVKGAKITGEIVKKGKAEKVIVYKFKRRKRYHRKKGHRQPLTEIKITKIEKVT
ncbi:MAG TPA: 50S ribosomal protein L21 [Candidatus Omnitrophica bacterium]|nr:50S ribosomal protein L21 [Candidatus Omnitrophota bacterium]